MPSSPQVEVRKIQITQQLLDNLDYDRVESKHTMTSTSGDGPVVMFVFDKSDLDAATYYLAKSLEVPLNPNAVECIYVHESCVERFAGNIKAKLKPYSEQILNCPKSSIIIQKAADITSNLNAKTIRPDGESPLAPTVVYDFPRKHFTEDGSSPIVILHTFRTVKEAITLSKSECVQKNASIWCENHAMAYELIAATSMENYYLNCFNVAWDPIAEDILKDASVAAIDKCYHYERLKVSGKPKNIVFPFGTTFAN